MTTEAEEKTQPGGAMPKAYDPSSVEGRVYRMWEEGGYFRPSDDPGREPFCIIMPPPNLTGELHLGHALMDTVEDILIRWHRMRGFATLWLPGIDHAAIAVHTLVERQLAQEGKTRYDVGREEFLRRTWEFVNRSRARIFDQHKRLAASADWERERFTMDPGPARAVRTVFYNLYKKGLIYRGERLINWCPRCQTAISDLEVVYQEWQGHLWHVRYPLLDDAGNVTDEYITIATTRPETIVADTGVAVHPDDERYKGIVGRKAKLPIIGREIPIVADEAIEAGFGTGALKVTPGHDTVDFEIGQRHDLPIVNSIALDGTMSDEAGPYAGMDRFECRTKIVEDLREQGFLVKEEPYTHSIGRCQRCETVVEPLISEQWFVAVSEEYAPGKSIAGEALRVVNEGLVRFVPERFTKIYTNWMENIRDWCISRQLWWGHQIPVWYCDACGEKTVPLPQVETPERCESCGATGLRQDPDTLDTWFSSALWPVSTLGWPDETDDLRRFYPTDVMETGYDIIFFWVARMIMMCTFCMEDRRETAEERIPFRVVYLHGTVRDEHGQRMSKSKGNVIDPIELVDNYGADALRYSLITGSATGQDQRLQVEKVEAGRNFANKLWNAARFVVMQLEPGATYAPPSPGERDALPPEDRWILSRLARLEADVDRFMREYELNEAARRIYDFLWSEYCDWYVEMAKVRMREQGQGNREARRDPRPVLVHVLERGLRLLHPYMPFVTEEVWQRLRPFLAQPGAEALIAAPYPEADASWVDEGAETEVGDVIDIVRAIRNIRSEKRVEASKQIEAYVIANSSTGAARIEAGTPYIEALARVRPLRIVADATEAPREGVATAVLTRASVAVPIAGLLDIDAERARLEKEIADADAYLGRIEAKLGNEQFRSKAPADVVAKEEQRRDEATARLEGLRRALAELG